MVLTNSGTTSGFEKRTKGQVATGTAERQETVQIIMGSEEKQSCSSNQYCLPTFGLEYPNAEQQSSPLVQFYRPVEVQSNGGGTENGHSSKGRRVTATLTNGELWKKFMQVGTEMIITTMGRL